MSGAVESCAAEPNETTAQDTTPVWAKLTLQRHFKTGKNAREVSGRAERRTPGVSLESSRLAARCLNLHAFALLLLTGRDRA